MKRSLVRGAAITILAAIPSILFATPFASVGLFIALIVTDLIDVSQLDLSRLPYCWWLYAWYFGADARFTTKLAVTFLIPFVIAFTVMLVALARRRRRYLRPFRPGADAVEPERAASRIHGDADWMTMAEANTIFPGPHPRWGGIPVGEAYRPDLDETRRPFDEADPETWGQGGKSPLLLSPLTSGAISGIIVAGSGSYKTMSFIVPAMTTWHGAAVVLDPSTQVGVMVEACRRRMGHRVALLDPEHPKIGGFDVLSCIDIDHPLVIVHLVEFIDWCGSEQPGDKTDEKNDRFFAEAGKELQACLLADLLWDGDLPREKRTVREWRKRLTRPEKEMPKELMRIFAHSKSPYAKDIAGTLMKTFDETFSGIYKHATTDTKWLSIPAFADLLSEDTFNPADLTKGRLTVIVQIPDEAMKATPAVGRVIIGSIARTLLRARGQMATPVPLFLDEMDLLKHMAILAVLRDMGRKSKVPLFPMWQSVGQIEKTWGKDGKKAWYASAAWRLYAMINDEETAEEVSKRCGTYTVLARTEGTSISMQGVITNGGRTRGLNDNMSEQRRELLSAYDAQTALRPDEAIIIPRGKPALRCGRPLFWRRRDMVRLIEADRFRESAD